MSKLMKYVFDHTNRGECKCGTCIDKGDKPDPQGHVADMVFFKVGLKGKPDAKRLRELAKEHRGEFGECDPFDGNEHGFIELGGWLGDQGLALQFMALGHLLGLFDLLTPRSVLPPGLPDDFVMQMAGQGYVTIRAKKSVA